MRKFILKTILFSLFLALALFGVKSVMPQFEIVPFYFVSIGFFSLLAILVFYMLTSSLKQESKKFVYAFYYTTIIRLFGSITLLVIYLVIKGKNNMQEAVVFIILYFLYTGFEIVNLFPTLRPEIKKDQNK